MSKIYTKTGDRGTTGIHGGGRVPKDDIRIEANGTLDELNCQIGVVRSVLASAGSGASCLGEGRPGDGQSAKAELAEGSFRSAGRMPEPQSFDETLHEVQVNLMTVMSHVATPSAKRAQNPNPLPEDLVARCEKLIDALTEKAGENRYFLLPGGTPLAAQLQMARAICRRAERRLWTLHRQDPLPESILTYINRLSDLFFVMARAELNAQQWPEERWQSFAYKNKK